MGRGLGGRGVLGARGELGGCDEYGAAAGTSECDDGRLDGGVKVEGTANRSDEGLTARAGGMVEGGKINPTGVFTDRKGASCAPTRIEPSDGRASLACAMSASSCSRRRSMSAPAS